jgi:hypothetical protein
MQQRCWLRHSAAIRNVTRSIPDDVFGFFNLSTPFSHPDSVGLTHPLTEMNTMDLHGDKEWMTLMADNLVATCEAIVWKM